jgi:Fur family ferric uptake transcriptional regulator
MSVPTNIENRLHYELIRRHVSWTHQRNQVYLALYHHGPCAIQELITVLSGQVSQRTIYNAVDLLFDLGIARRFWQSGKSVLEVSAPYKQHHHHFTCTKCEKTISFNDNRIETAIAQFDRTRHLRLTGHQLELTGLCATCAQTP